MESGEATLVREVWKNAGTPLEKHIYVDACIYIASEGKMSNTRR
jgi:hypothetical protein